ncbi:MAG TPA: phospholipase D-like domain-containing protein [Ktedonobacterales bacterium]
MSITTYTSPDINAYFQSKRAGLDAQLVERIVAFIDATNYSLDCAIYDLRHPDILAALARVAARPHIRLRIAYDNSGERNGGLEGDPKPSGTAEAIAEAGLAPHATGIHEHGRHLMHDKYLVRDGRTVWVGSANFTAGGLELQDNNCLAIQSQALAALYSASFEELISPQHTHSDGRLRQADPAPTPPAVTVDGARITPYFAPAAGEGIEDTLVEALRHARRVRIMAFLIGDPGVLEALRPFASDHHFDIRGIYDPHGMEDVTRASGHHGATAHAGRTGKGKRDETSAAGDADFWFLRDPRFIAAPTHGFSPGREQDFMHNKVIVVDDHLVFTGSYNFSENAEANDETMLAIDSPPLAHAYTAYFDALASAYSPAGVREPVAVGAASGAAAAAYSDQVVSQLRSEHLQNERATKESRKESRRERAASSHAASRADATPRHTSRLDSAILLVVALMALTILALVAFGALVYAGVLFH